MDKNQLIWTEFRQNLEKNQMNLDEFWNNIDEFSQNLVRIQSEFRQNFDINWTEFRQNLDRIQMDLDGFRWIQTELRQNLDRIQMIQNAPGRSFGQIQNKIQTKLRQNSEDDFKIQYYLDVV